jgi:hypothetical protein
MVPLSRGCSLPCLSPGVVPVLRRLRSADELRFMLTADVTTLALPPTGTTPSTVVESKESKEDAVVVVVVEEPAVQAPAKKMSEV